MVWDEVVEADLRCGVGEFRAGGFVALWSVSGAERAAGGAASGSCYPREFRTGIREVRDSTIATRGQAAEAARFAFSRLWCLGGRVWNLARRSADRDAKF